MKSLIRLFASLKLTLVLIIVVGILSAVGTFFPQGEQAKQNITMYGQEVYDFLNALGILDTYNSWWFLVVLAVFFLNLAACTAERLPKVWRLRQKGSKADLADDSIPKTRDEVEFEVTLEPSAAGLRAEAMLKKHFSKVVIASRPDGGRVLAAEKHGLALWGAYIVHTGLFLLLIAGGIRILFGYSLNMAVLEGQEEKVPKIESKFGFWMETLPIPGTSLGIRLPRLYARIPAWDDFTIHLDEFKIEYHEKTGSPSLFQSTVKLQREKQELLQAQIEVNHPLSFQGVNIYQASWGYEGLRAAQFILKLPNGDEFEVIGPYRKRFGIEGTAWEAEITDFYPEAGMASPGKLELAGYQLDNPAMRMRLYFKGKEKAHFWTMFRYPEIQMSKVKGLEVIAKTVDPIAFTVLQIGHDPGVPVALAGALFVIFGVFASFYLYFRKIWIEISPIENGQGCRVRLAGMSKRHRASFEVFFSDINQQLRAALEKGV